MNIIFKILEQIPIKHLEKYEYFILGDNLYQMVSKKKNLNSKTKFKRTTSKVHLYATKRGEKWYDKTPKNVYMMIHIYATCTRISKPIRIKTKKLKEKHNESTI